MFNLNKLDKTFTFFYDTSRYKIVPDVNNNGKTGRMAMYVIHTKKGINGKLETFQVPLTIWGSLTELQEFELQMFKAQEKKPLSKNGKILPITLVVVNGTIESFTKNVRDENGNNLKYKNGVDIVYPEIQINVNLNGHSTILIEPEHIGSYNSNTRLKE